MIEFTQYLRPNGRPVQVLVDRPADVEALARQVVDRGGRFEAEVLLTEEVSFTVEQDDWNDYHGEPVAIEVVPNGPGVPEAVDRLVRTAHERLAAVGA